VDRTAFYGNRPYAHLREEFEARLRALRQAGEVTDHRLAQIAGLKSDIDALKQRLASREQTIAVLTDLKIEALSRLAAQHEEIIRLRVAHASLGNIRRLPARAPTVGS
jgi:hypothetical protein